jgi:hypothetical protein
MDATGDTGERRFDGSGIACHSVVIIAVVFALLSVVGAAGTATAIDQVAIISPDRTTVEAAPGETIRIDVALRSQGGHGGEGVEAVTLITRYHPEYLEITDIDRGPWLEGTETEINATETIAHERGTAILEQRREPAAGGTTGTGTIATVTVRVAEDAPAGTTTISFGESDVTLTGDYPPAVVDESTTVAIDGGTETLDPFDHPDPDEIDRESAASNPGDDSTGSANESADAEGGEPIPGFTGGGAILAVLLAALRLATGRDGRRE